MQIHTIAPKTESKRKKRVGRGGKRGTYSGRGIKGLGARAGGKYRPQERDILKKIPKLRGYKFKSFRPKPAVVNLADVVKRFSEGATISPDTLIRAGMIHRTRGKTPQVKILGRGEAAKKFVFKGVEFSRSAAAKINP